MGTVRQSPAQLAVGYDSMRAYHRIDPLMDERKGHYTPAQLGAFVKVQLLAGRQTSRGRFRSVAALRASLPAAYARHVDFLVTEGDLDVLTDGTVYLDGWDEWQEGDLTVKDRMARLRNKHRNPSVTSTVTAPYPTAIRSSVGIGVGISGAIAPSARDEPHIEAWLMAKHRLPTVAQQAFLDRYLKVFDVTGPERMAAVILRHSDDPIAALKADLDKHREERLGELGNGHAPTPKPRPKREPWQQLLREKLAADEAALLERAPLPADS